MASSSNIGLARLPWGRLPRSPVSSPSGRGGSGSELEMSFRDIMAEQQKETCQEQDFDEYIQNSYVTVGGSSSSSEKEVEVEEVEERDVPEMEKSFLQLEDLDTDLKLVMSFYEDQDFDDAAYELSEQDLDALDDDDSDKYYEGLAKKLSTVVELKGNSLSKSTISSSKGNKGSRTSGSLKQNFDTLIDAESKVILDKMKRKGVLRGPASPAPYRILHMGENAVILHAGGGMLPSRRDDPIASNVNAPKLRLPKECAVKVFKNTKKTTKSETGEEEEKLIEAKREMTHLNRMTRAGVPCPQVQFLHEHILVTDFLGKDGQSAKKLKHSNDLNNRSVLNAAYTQIIKNVKTLFKTYHLVHGDLSEDNILWHKRQAYFTSVGGAVNSNRSMALELLYRDCTNITEFFGRKGKPDCDTPQQLFRWITGFDFTGQLQEEACGSSEHDDFAIV